MFVNVVDGAEPDAAPTLPTGAKRRASAYLRARLYGILILLDTLCIFAAFAAAAVLRMGDPFHGDAREMVALSLVFYLVLAFYGRGYSHDVLSSPRLSVRRGLTAMLITAASLTLTFFLLKAGAGFSRILFTIGTIGSLGLIGLARYAFGHWAGRRYGWNFIDSILLLDDAAHPDVENVRTIDARAAGLRPRVDDPLAMDAVARLLRHVDRVIVASSPERREAWATMLRGMATNVEILAPELDKWGCVGTGDLAGSTTFLVSRGPLGLRDRILKRLFDLAIAVPLFVAALPLMIVIALAIRVESRGPVFFRQQRIGQNNQLFSLLKFRSMYSERLDQAGQRSTARDDDRITAVGRFIRRTSLDELPQLINVMVGNMSLVGPRPHALASTAGNALFWEVDRRYWDRHAAKPGITGLAQVRGFRGATAEPSDLTERLKADLEYLNGWSLGRDIAILVRTAKVLLHRNAF